MAAKPEDLGDQDKDLTPTLVAGLREGDPEAGKLLNTLYRERLIRFCWGYLGAIDEAEDAVQEIYDADAAEPGERRTPRSGPSADCAPVWVADGE